MFTLTATKGTEIITKNYSQYYQALTVGITLQNKDYKVEIKKA